MGVGEVYNPLDRWDLTKIIWIGFQTLDTEREGERESQLASNTIDWYFNIYCAYSVSTKMLVSINQNLLKEIDELISILIRVL